MYYLVISFDFDLSVNIVTKCLIDLTETKNPDTGFAPNTHQTIIWTNDDPTNWHKRVTMDETDITIMSMYLWKSERVWELFVNPLMCIIQFHVGVIRAAESGIGPAES